MKHPTSFVAQGKFTIVSKFHAFLWLPHALV